MTSRLIPRSSISNAAAQKVVWGFACGTAKAEIAKEAGISEKATLSILLALRPRLFGTAFYRWINPGTLFITRDVPYQADVERAFYGVMALCYENKRCLSNYRQGRRAGRACLGCPLDMVFEETDTMERVRRQLDHIHSFYAHLGIGGEREPDRARFLQTRWAHTLVVDRARAASTLTAKGVPRFQDDDRYACRALYDQLVADLTDQPLQRPRPSAAPL
ncbi:MAG: hypothetical protein Kilf2KO_34800 [Rhodospirillales bacterium]